MSDEVHWQRIVKVFDLGNPVMFASVPLGGKPLGAEDQQVLRRYLSASEEMASSSILAPDADIGNSASFGQDEEVVVETSMPSGEALRGLAVIFRQFYSPDEKASFQSVMKILITRSDGALQEELRRWGKAAGTLQQKFFEHVVREYLVAEMGIPAPPGPLDENLNPSQVISAYFYGEHIHWGEKAEQVEEWSEDEFFKAHRELQFLQAVVPLAHIYIRFAGFASHHLG